jgi:DNA topoisomerase VI subunit B
MTSEYAIVTNKEYANSDNQPQQQLSTKVLRPVLTGYSSRTCVVNNRPTIVECGIAYGGDISSFKLHRFANKIPLLYDEGSDVAREVVSEVEINKMGISKKEVKEQFANPDSKSDRAVELLPIHIFFHICSTKIPYKTAGKESIASEGDLKRYMKACLADLYRKVSAQIRKELRIKEAESRLRLYKHYIPLIINAISESIRVDPYKLSEAFSQLAEKHVRRGESIDTQINTKADKITGERIKEEAKDKTKENENEILKQNSAQHTSYSSRKKKNKINKTISHKKKSKKFFKKERGGSKNRITLDTFNKPKERRM